MHGILSSFFSSLRDFVIPPRKTERMVNLLTLLLLEDARHTENGALPYHDERVRALVWELKYYANKRAATLAGEIIAERLLEVAEDSIGKPLLIPIPMHPLRRKERGHNQTELLAETALKHLCEGGNNAFEYAPHILERIKHTSQQQGLPQHTRLKNVEKSMHITQSEKVKGRVCILLDDVSTTGATFAEAKRVLHKAGAKEVITIALAQS